VVETTTVLARLRSDRHFLARLTTLIENEDSQGIAYLEAIYPYTGQAHVVGVTGPPGVGKSALIAALLETIRESGRQVAVIAIDPSSPFTGGAVLGDRVRMMRHHADEGVYIRSMASRGRTGGLAWATAEVIHLLDAAGFPLIIIETVGTGQDGTDVASLVDTVLVVAAPGLGDGVQAMKSGLVETGDILVVNKADRPGAVETLRTLRAAVALAPPAERRVTPVLATSATETMGIGELLHAIDEHRGWLAQSGDDQTRRSRAARAEVLAALRATMERRLSAASGTSRTLAEVVSRVAQREITARHAAGDLADVLDLPLLAAPCGSIGDERRG
jgi:LAO/AO transport system kinase